MSPFTARLRARVAVTLAAVMLLVAPARAIDFLFFYDDPDGQGFMHPTQGAIRRAALEEAGEIWGRLIPSTYEGETVEVRAKFDAYPAGSMTWASASPNYFYSDFDSTNPAYQEEVNYPKALANHLALRDLAPVRHEIEITVNQAQTFFFGIHGTPSPSEGDFISIAVHELGHGLGYDMSFQQDGDFGILGARTVTDPCPGCLPMPYDTFLTLGAGGPTLTSLSTSQIQSALVSDNVYWNGASATAANGGAAVQINAPNPFNPGSSIGHLDPGTFPNAIMGPGIGAGVVNRIPSFVDRALLRDMGWTINVTPSQVHWTGLGADNDATTAGNWSPALPEADDRLVFDQSATTDVDMNLPLGTIQWISFPATAPAYTLRFKSNVDMDITDNGINNSSPSAQTIFLESPLEDEPTPSLFDSAATLTFKNTANAGSGNVDYYLSGGGTLIGGGPPPHIPHRFDRYAGASVIFENNSTAGTASFELEGGSGDGGPNAQVTFRHDSTASAAEFRTKGGRLGPSLPLGNVAVGFGGQVLFEDNAKAGLATFRNEGQADSHNGAGGFTVFTDSSNAEGAEIHNHGATYVTGLGGATFFYDSSTAGSAQITNHSDGSNHVNYEAQGRTIFLDNSNAGMATIENQGAPSQSQRPGRTEFRGNSSAANSTIHNRGFIQVGDLAGRTDFYNTTTASNATIHIYEGYSDTGRVEFHDDSTAADARIFVNDVPEIVGSSGNGGHVVFRDDSTAARSQITLRAGACCNGVQFYNDSTAADAQITTENGSGGVTFWGNSTAGDVTTTVRSRFSLGEGSVMSFYDQSNAADASITLANRAIANFAGTSAGDAEILAAGGAVYTAGSQAYVSFGGNNATAAEATIIALGASAPLASPATIYFTGGASAGNADLIAHGGTNGGAGASIVFNGAANGSTARVNTTAGALVDFADQRIYNDISLGSIHGAGTFALKGAHVTVGNGNSDTVVTGPIIDHPTGFVSGGRLTKMGTGRLTLAGANAYSGVTTVNAGTLRVTGSIVGGVVVNSGGRLEDVGHITGGIQLNGGVYAPGTSPGISTIDGLTMMPGSTLEFEIGDPLRDRIVLTNNGNITLDGILKILLLDSFMPGLGQSFPLFEGAIGSISGTFDTIIAPIFNGMTFDVVQNAGSVLLQVGEATLVPGDYNRNGIVDAADYVVWRKTGGTPDGYNAWRANFGATAVGAAAVARSGATGSASANSAVPEPASGILFGIGVVGILMAMRRRTAAYGAVALSVVLAAPAVADVTVQDNIAFNANKLNPYGEGPAWSEQRVFSLIPNEPLGFDGKIRADLPFINVDPVAVALEAVLGVSLPSLVKGQLGATIAGSTNLSFGYYVTAGQLDISYPAASNINFQTVSGGNHVLGNQQYTIGSDFLPGVSQRLVTSQFLQTSGGAGYLSTPLGGVSFTDYSSPSFATTSPWAQAWIDASADLHAGIHTKVTALGGVKEWRKDFNIDAKVGGRLVEVDPNGLWVAGEPIVEFNVDQPYGPIPVPGPGGPANLEIRLPKLDVVSDPISGEVLHARGVKPVATLTGNLEKLIPFVGGFLHNNFGPLEYDLLQLSGGPQISLYQDMTFTPDPKVRLAFSEPVQVAGSQCGSMVCAGAGPLRVTQVAEFDLGQDDIVWKPMFSNDNSITIKPTYVMNANFRNETGIDVRLLVDVDALSFKAPFFTFEEDQTIGPYFTKEFTFELFDVELFTQSFPVPIGNVTAGPITIPKLNLGVEVGLGDLDLVTSNFIGFDPQGHDIYELTFNRTVVGENEPRVYQATVTGTYTNFTPEGGGEGDEAFYIESLQDVMLTDPVTSVQYNLGRNICMSGCNLSSWLPASSPGYDDPNLGTLYLTELPTDPNIGVDVPNHPILGQYNGSVDTIPGPPVEGPVEFVDKRDLPDATILARKGEIIPDGIGRFNSFNFGSFGINEAGGVAYFSNLTVVPPGSGTVGFYYADDTSKTKLVRSGELVPGGSQTIVFFGGASSQPNELGQVALVTQMSGSFSNSVVLRGGPDGLKTIARNGQTAPDGNGTFQDFAGASLNDAGQVAFWSRVTYPGLGTDEVIYVSDATVLSEIAREGNAAPGMPGQMSSFGYLSLNNSGQVAFDVSTTAFVQGLYIRDGNNLHLIAADGGAVPHGGEFVGINDHVLNDAGQVAFAAGLREFPGGPLMFGIFRGDETSLVQIAREGQLAPDGDGMLKNSLFTFQMNDVGQVVFRGSVDAASDYQAILLGDGGNLTQIARDGTPAPDGSGPITEVGGVPQLNNHSHVAFEGVLPDSFDEARSVFLYDSANLVQVVRVGQPLAGSTVTFTSLLGINDDMQVAYRAGLANGNTVIARFEPSIYWSKTVSGNWGTADNWSLGIEPRDPYDVHIVAENPLTVAGPAVNRSVKSLTLGADDSASVTLNLPSGVTLTATNGTTIRRNGVVTGLGTLAGSVVNDGTVSPGSSPGALHIDGDFTQSSAGTLAIEIASATNYDRLLVSGDVALGGTLAVSLLDGFVPTEGQQFSIFGDQFNSIAGAFQTIEFPMFNGLTFAVSQTFNSIMLQVVEFVGDYNHDGSVDAADYVIWRKNDRTQQGYNIWRANFGTVSPGIGAGSGSVLPSTETLSAAVPEPATWTLLILAASAVRLRRRQWSRAPQNSST